MSDQDQLEQLRLHAGDEPAHGRSGQVAGADLVSIVLTVPLPAVRMPTRTGRHQVVDQVRSLRRSISGAGLGSADAEILVIDGGALGMSDIAPLQAQSARAVPSPRSASGRAALRNCGLARAAHPLVLFIDADIELGEALLPALLAVIRDPDVAAVGPWLVPSTRRNDRPAQEQAVSALSGGCLLARRDHARQVRGFNEALKPDLACDVDFGLRLRAAGHRIVCTPLGLPTHPPAEFRIEDPQVMATLSGVWNGLTSQAIDENRVLTDTQPEPPDVELPPMLHPAPTAAFRPDPPPPAPPVEAATPSDPTFLLRTAIPDDELDLRDILLGLMLQKPQLLSATLSTVAVLPEVDPEPVIQAVPRPQPVPRAIAPSRPPAITTPVAAWSRSQPVTADPPAPTPSRPKPGRRSSWRRSV